MPSGRKNWLIKSIPPLRAGRPVQVTSELVKPRGPEGSNPLMYAAHYGDANQHNDADVATLLWAAPAVAKMQGPMQGGADVNAKNTDGWTPLHLAKLYGETPVVEALLRPVRNTQPTPRAAVKRGYLTFTRESGCTSCHNQGLTGVALGAARKADFSADDRLATDETRLHLPRARPCRGRCGKTGNRQSC